MNRSGRKPTVGAIWYLWELPRLEVLVSTTVLSPPSPQQSGSCSILVIWPTCKAITAHFQSHYKEIIQAQREQTGATGHHHMHLTSLPRATPAEQASTPGAVSTCPAPTSLPKLLGTHSVHRSCLYTRSLSLQQTREGQY